MNFPFKKTKKHYVSQHDDIFLATFSVCLIKLCTAQRFFFNVYKAFRAILLQYEILASLIICEVLGTFDLWHLKNAWNFSKALLLIVGVTQWS